MKKFLKLLLIGNLKTNTFLVAIIAPYFLFCLYPDFNFEFCKTSAEIKICSHQRLSNAEEMIENIRQGLNKSEIYDPSLSLSVYITQSHNEYRVFSPISTKSFAQYLPFFRNVYINKSDLKTKNVFRSYDERQRDLSQTIIHEATHKLIHNKIGIVKTLFLPTWVSEGYSDYIAGESTYSLEEAALLIKAKTIKDNPSAMYRVYLESVSYLIEEKNFNFESLRTYSGSWEDLQSIVFNRILERTNHSVLL